MHGQGQLERNGNQFDLQQVGAQDEVQEAEADGQLLDFPVIYNIGGKNAAGKMV